MENPPALNITPVEGATSPQPMRQNIIAQHQHAPILSPTSAQMGQPEPQKSAQSFENLKPETPKPVPPKPPQPTIPRRPPSWER